MQFIFRPWTKIINAIGINWLCICRSTGSFGLQTYEANQLLTAVRYNLLIMKKGLLLFSLLCNLSINSNAQADTSFLELNSKMWFISEIDHDQVMMDEEGNQFDCYNNFILVDFENSKLKIPYNHNYIFWDEYDEDMNVKKKTYRIILKKIQLPDIDGARYLLFKVFDNKDLLYDVTLKNPFIQK